VALGQATLPLARRGCHIVCVEMGANLAGIARRNLAGFPRVTVDTARFEDWHPAGLSFDIVFAATVHGTGWIRSSVTLRRPRCCAQRACLPSPLVPRVPPGFDPFFAEIQNCYKAIGEAPLEWPPPAPEEMPDAREEIEHSGYFEKPSVTRRIRSTSLLRTNT